MPSLAAALVALTPFFAASVDAHGYLKAPRARNYVAYQTGEWSGSSNTKPPAEDCPMCLNKRVPSDGGCGLVGTKNYDNFLSSSGSAMPWTSEAVYKKGDVVQLEVVLTAHHRGHFQFKACPLDTSKTYPTQACFDANPLAFVSDPLYGAPVHAEYPERVYIAPSNHPSAERTSTYPSGMVFKPMLRLPASVTGDRVLIQWHYVSGNSCEDVGYDSYQWPTGAEWRNPNVGKCTQPLPPDGNGTPEQFWNCVEVSITETGATPASVPKTPQAPTPTPPKTSDTNDNTSGETTGTTADGGVCQCPVGKVSGTGSEQTPMLGMSALVVAVNTFRI